TSSVGITRSFGFTKFPGTTPILRRGSGVLGLSETPAEVSPAIGARIAELVRGAMPTLKTPAQIANIAVQIFRNGIARPAGVISSIALTLL
ncbi:MAG: hypothetical protein ABI680_16475, partial [Chthoniobacteraceae bacterium]